MPTIKSLSKELLTEVCKYLSTREDQKIFRLISRVCDPIASQFLFQKICLSRLAQHWSVFENIATNPKIAIHVRELVWYDLFLEGYQERDPFEMPIEDVHLLLGVEELSRGDDFHTLATFQNDAVFDSEIFWLPKPRTTHRHDPDSREIQDRFKTRFCELVGKLPQLETLVSCPMPSDHKIVYKGYSFPACMFTAMLSSTYAQDRIIDPFDPIMLGLRSLPQVTCLQLATDHFLRNNLPDIVRLYLQTQGGLRSLTSIDVGFQRVQSLGFEYTVQRNLLHCSGEACGIARVSSIWD